MRCLALFTGGLDSQIAVRMMHRQGIEVIGFHVQTPFTASSEVASEAAQRLGIELIRQDWSDGYLDIVRRPRFGYAAELAPCVDCRIGMLQMAKARMSERGASFIVSGEIIGQRPSSLRSRELETMAVHGGVDDLLLRPLSATLLPPTMPERSGWVNRELLHSWHGKGRREQLRVAGEWELSEPVGHQAGCQLLQSGVANRMNRLLALERGAMEGELTTLSFGRHYSLGAFVHVVVARHVADGNRLIEICNAATSEVHLIEPVDFRGPIALCFGTPTHDDWEPVLGLISAASKSATPGTSRVKITVSTSSQIRTIPEVAFDCPIQAWQ